MIYERYASFFFRRATNDPGWYVYRHILNFWTSDQVDAYIKQQAQNFADTLPKAYDAHYLAVVCQWQESSWSLVSLSGCDAMEADEQKEMLSRVSDFLSSLPIMSELSHYFVQLEHNEEFVLLDLFNRATKREDTLKMIDELLQLRQQ